MKYLSLTILCLTISQLSNAEVHISKKVYQDLVAAELSKEIQAKIINSIWDAQDQFTVGDDGKDCPSRVENITMTKKAKNNLKLSYFATQDYDVVQGCMDVPALCKLEVDLENNQINTITKCEYQY